MIAELVGTFALTFVAVGGAVIGAAVLLAQALHGTPNPAERQAATGKP